MAASGAQFYRSTGFVTNTGTSIVCPKPAGAVEGDLLIVKITWVSSGGVTLTPTSGWTEITGIQKLNWGTGSALSARTFWKIVGDEVGTTSYTSTLSSSVGHDAIMRCIGNVDQTNPIEGFSTPTTGNGTAISNAGYTTGEANIAAFYECQSEANGTYSGITNGFTEVDDQGNYQFAGKLIGSAGAIGSTASTASASGQWLATMVGVRGNSTATRFYFDSAASAPVTPTLFDASWEDTASATVKALNVTKGASAKANVTVTETSTTSSRDLLHGQHVYGPIAGQTISGGFRCQIRSLESATGMNAVTQIVIWIMKPDGTARSVLYAGVTSTANVDELATTATNARFPRSNQSVHMTSQTATSGDYLVVETGVRAINTSATSFTSTLRYGESATDLAEDITTTTDNCPWIQFDNGITAASTAAALVAAPTWAFTGAGALTTGIPVAAAGTTTFTGTAALTTGIPLSAAASTAFTSSAAVTTSIKLATAASTAFTGAGALTTAIPLAAAGSSTWTGTGALSTAIPLAATATSAFTSSAALTTAIPLAAAGSSVWTSAVDLTATGSGAALATAASSTWSGTAALTTGIPLAAAASTTVTGSVALSTAIPLAAAASSTWTGTSALTTAIPLAAAASTTFTSTSALTTAIQLQAAASVTFNGVGTIGSGAALVTAASTTFSGTAALTTAIPLAAAGASTFTGSSALTTAIRLQSAATTTFSGAVSLTTQIVLTSAGQVTFTGVGALSTSIKLVATPQVVWTGSAELLATFIPTATPISRRIYAATDLRTATSAQELRTVIVRPQEQVEVDS